MPVMFGFNAIALFCQKTNLKLSQVSDLNALFSVLQMRDIITLIWCGLSDGARYKRKTEDPNYPKFEATEEDVGDWLTDSPEVFTMAQNMFIESNPKPVEGEKKSQESP